MAAPSSGGPRPHIPWEFLRDVYLARFGPLFVAEPEHRFEDDVEYEYEGEIAHGSGFTDEVSHYTLTFGAPDTGPRVVFATLGAAQHTGGHELFVECALPYTGLARLLVDERLTAASLAPGKVIPAEIEGTPFEAVLLAPPSAGSLPFSCPDGATRFALRAIPLTGPEQKLARRSLPRLLDALERAGATGPVDLFRDCVVAPDKTRRHWAAHRASLVEELCFQMALRLRHYRHIAAHRGSSAHLANAGRHLVLAHTALRAVSPAELPAALGVERVTERIARHEKVLERVHEQADARIWALLDGEWREALLETTGLVLLTHPVAQRLLVEAGAISGELHLDTERMIAEVAEWMGRFHPRADIEEITDAGRIAAARAGQTRLLDDGQVSPPEAWKHICFAMAHALFHPARPRPLPPRELVETVFAGMGAAADGILLDIAEPETAIERLGQTLQIVGIIFLARRFRIPATRDPEDGPAGRVLH